METYSSILSFYSSANVKWHTKLLSLLIIVVLLLLLNGATDFTFYYTNSRRVEQVARLTEVLRAPSLIPLTRVQLMRLRAEILMHESAFSTLLRSSTYLSSVRIADITLHNDTSANISPHATRNEYNTTYIIPKLSADVEAMIIKEIIQKNTNKRSDIALYFSSSSGLIALFILICFSVSKEYVSTGKKKMRFGEFFDILLMFVALTIFSFLSYFIFGLLFPTPIFGCWWATYAVIAILSFIFPLIVAFPPTKRKTSKQETA